MTVLNLYAQKEVAQLEEKHLKRSIAQSQRQEGIYIFRNGRKLLSFCCNDYFGLTQHAKVITAAIQATKQYGAGAGASRLVTGNNPLYTKLEQTIADYKETEAACVFGSGYLTNIGVIPALVGKADVVFADKEVHACIIDGIKLSGAKLIRFKHNDTESLDRQLSQHRGKYDKSLIITETIFSMDGQFAPLEEISALAKNNESWLMADDAHGLGITKPNKDIDIQVGTLSKAAGSYGGYVAGTAELISLIQNRANPLIFSTGLPPGTLAAANAAIEIISQEPERISKPVKYAQKFAAHLGLSEPESTIIPIILGNEEEALLASKQLEKRGYLVTAIRPPTVPKGTSRLRITFSSLHKPDQVEGLAKSIVDLGIIK